MTIDCFPFIMEYNGLKILIAKPNSSFGTLVKPARKTQPLMEGQGDLRSGKWGRGQARTASISHQDVLLINDFFTVHTLIGLQPFLFIYP